MAAEGPAQGLGKKTRRAISWNAANALATNVLRLAVIAILGRLLSPEDFGVVAAAMTVILLAGMLRDFGLGQALVQRKELEPEHVEVAFTVTVVQGLVLTGLIAALAGPIADFFEMETSASLIRALAVLFVLRSLSIVPTFVLQRSLEFRALSIADFTGYVVGSALSITLAMLGHGPWSLVWGYAAETLVNTVLVQAAAKLPWRLRWHPRHVRELLGYGLGRSLASFGNYFANQGDYMVIGRMLDKAQLGLYQRAYELVRFPAAVFSSVAGSVLFSAVSKVQDDPERMGRVLRRTTFASAIVLLPAAAGLFVLAPEVIRILLGDQWDGVVWPFRVMVTTMLFRTTYKLGGLVGRSSGEVYRIARWQWLYAAMVIGGATLSVAYGILGVAVTTSIAIVINFAGMYRIGLRMTNLRAVELVTAHVEPLVFAAIVGGVAWGTAEALRAAELSVWVIAGATTATGALAYVVLMAIRLRRGAGDWPWLKETLAAFAGRGKKKKKKAKAEAAEAASSRSSD